MVPGGVLHHPHKKTDGWKEKDKHRPKPRRSQSLNTGSIIPGLGYVVNNHGDYKSPNSMGLWIPFQMAELHGF